MRRLGRKLLLTFFVFFLVLTIIDATASKRNLLQQLDTSTLLRSPLNVITHLGTPQWLRKKLFISPILKPTTKLFPNLLKLRNALPMLKREAMNGMKASKPIMNDLFFQGIADKGWKRFYIKWYGPTDPLAKKLCPETCALLESMPEVHLGMFSILMPGSKITPHCGPARMCLRYHMGLFTPNSSACKITVGNDVYSWKDNEDVIFDDTVQHEVENLSNLPRIILFLDIERPQEGLFKHATKAMIKYGGPMTTRTNDKKEKIVQM